MSAIRERLDTIAYGFGLTRGLQDEAHGRQYSRLHHQLTTRATERAVVWAERRSRLGLAWSSPYRAMHGEDWRLEVRRIWYGRTIRRAYDTGYHHARRPEPHGLPAAVQLRTT